MLQQPTRQLRNIERYQEAFNRGIPTLERRDFIEESLRPDGTTPRSTRNAQKRGIMRWAEHEAKCWQEAFFEPGDVEAYVEEFGHTPAEARMKETQAQVDEYYANLDPDSLPEQQTDTDRWQREKRADVYDNFVYREWVNQLGSTNEIRTYAVYALVLGLRSGLHLLTAGQPTMVQAMQERHPYPLPDRAKALAFVNDDTYNPHDWQALLREVETFVPGIYELAQTILIYYADLTRVERLASPERVDTTPLPDDPGDQNLTTMLHLSKELRTERAISAYTAKEGSATEVATRYGLPQKAFIKELRERGLMRATGGNRKK